MLQTLAMMFFSILAAAAGAMLLETLVEGWADVRRALDLDGRVAPLPRPRASGRIRPVRRISPVAVRLGLRAAA
jgi:hypothetical protein